MLINAHQPLLGLTGLEVMCHSHTYPVPMLFLQTQLSPFQYPLHVPKRCRSKLHPSNSPTHLCGHQSTDWFVVTEPVAHMTTIVELLNV